MNNNGHLGKAKANLINRMSKKATHQLIDVSKCFQHSWQMHFMSNKNVGSKA